VCVSMYIYIYIYICICMYVCIGVDTKAFRINKKRTDSEGYLNVDGDTIKIDIKRFRKRNT
jgi:hypothetical protein